MADGPAFVRGRVVSEDRDGDVGRCVLEFPSSNWGRNVPMLVSSLVAGEGVETRAFTRCRLVGLSLPDGLLPGPRFGAIADVRVGVIVKPSLGLSPDEVAAVADTAARSGASLIKDDELLGSPDWCPLEDRVRAVAARLHPSVVYCANVTGPTATLLDRARRAVDLGATGIMVNAFAQGLDAVLALRDADLGVPLFAHRVGSGPWTRSDRFGVSGAVLAMLCRACGADYVQVGAYGGKLFDTDDEVDAQLHAARSSGSGAASGYGSASDASGWLPATAVLGGGIGPQNARAQAERAGGTGLLLLLGSAAYTWDGGLSAAVRATVEAAGAAVPSP